MCIKWKFGQPKKNQTKQSHANAKLVQAKIWDLLRGHLLVLIEAIKMMLESEKAF